MFYVDEEAAKKMKEILQPIGKEGQKAAKDEDRPQDLYFFVASAGNSIILDSLCEFLGMDKDQKSLFILDVPAGKIYKSESAEVKPEVVRKFINDFRNDVLVAKDIRG